MCNIVPVESVGISKDSRRLFKRDAMLFKVGNRLRDIPRKDIRVYTLTRPWSQGLMARRREWTALLPSGCESNAAGLGSWLGH